MSPRFDGCLAPSARILVQDRALRAIVQHLTRSFAWIVACAVALVIAAPASAPAQTPGGVAYFPNTRAPVQIAREVNLQRAAQAGVVKLESKGGGEGDAVSLELTGKQIPGDVTVTVRAEFTVPDRLDEENRAAVRDGLAEIAAKTEAELNRIAYKSSGGDTIRFKVQYQYRDPNTPPDLGYHQVRLVNPTRDLAEPDPDYRSNVEGLGKPNVSEEALDATFTFGDLASPSSLAHESLHLIGLDDRYSDFYRAGGQDYPLPRTGMSPADVRSWARAHKPRLAAPPSGKVIQKNLKGVDRCDVMGTGFESACRRITQRDLDWLASQAGLQVTAEPGDLLLNKDPSRQNFGVAYRSVVFAGPGETTVANGVAVYCLDHDRLFPFGGGFDVGAKSTELPGYEGVARLLALNATIQPSLTESVAGMQAAIWNLTDASPLETSGTAEASRALMAQAGVAEDSVPGGLPALGNPNAGSPSTTTVGAAGAVLPSVPARDVTPALVRLDAAQLYPARLRAGRRVYGDLALTVGGRAEQVAVRVERRAGRRWRKVRTFAARPLDTEVTPVSLAFGRLRAGAYRLVVSVSGRIGAPAVKRVSFRVRG